MVKTQELLVSLGGEKKEEERKESSGISTGMGGLPLGEVTPPHDSHLQSSSV